LGQSRTFASELFQSELIAALHILARGDLPRKGEHDQKAAKYHSHNVASEHPEGQPSREAVRTLGLEIRMGLQAAKCAIEARDRRPARCIEHELN
jgi:hypothetical protein